MKQKKTLKSRYTNIRILKMVHALLQEEQKRRKAKGDHNTSFSALIMDKLKK